jgi:hypothetical protein
VIQALVGRRIRGHVSVWPMIGRGLILTISTWTAALQLWVPTSVAARAAGESSVMDVMNMIALALCALGWLDILVHDIGGRLLLPRISMRLRHQVCVALYSALGLAYWVRSFVSSEQATFTLQVGALYLIVGAFAMAAAAAIAREDLFRKGDA